MRALTFVLHGGTFALPLDAIKKLLAPDEPIPDGCKVIDLADRLEMREPEASAGGRAGTERQRALLAGGAA
ncbi:MAG TPA: hypothetical protein VFG76_12185, partial [Candidatus Polarisedimenticolia bacterium]|nr:hypothetical protein [Candidatus Polarisedimenticolia bacterium]